MKTNPIIRSHHRQFCRTCSVAAVAVGSLLGALAQPVTVVPPSLKAPPSSYNTSARGFLIRTHQILTPRTPGDQNSIANVERQLKGEFGPGIATNGPVSGYYVTDVVDFDVSRINYDPFGVGGFNYPFPGIDLDDLTPSPTYNPNNIAAEIIGFLELPAGETELRVRSNDSFRFTIGNGENPYDLLALQPTGAVFDGGRAAADSVFILSVSSAGVYPIRIVYGQGADAGTLEFSTLVNYPGSPFPILVNDPTWEASGYGLRCYLPASMPIVPSAAYLSYLQPAPGAVGVNPLPTIVAEIKDAGTTVDTNGISLAVDGSPVLVNLSKSNGLTTVTGAVTNLLTPNSLHTASLVYQDSTPKRVTNTWSFTVMNYYPVPASYAYPPSSQNAAKPGFTGKIHIARANQPFNASIGRCNAQLWDELIDYTLTPPAPYVNLVQTPAHSAPTDPNPVNADGTYVNTNVVNYSIASTSPNGVLDFGYFNAGNGYPDARYPGLPGWNDTTYTTPENARYLAFEEIAWLDLPAGLIVIGVYAKDAVQIALHRNDPRDIFRESVVTFDTNAGNGERTRLLYVQEAGLYGFRIAQAEWDVDPQIEFFTASASNPTQRTLVNDAAVTNSVKAYQELTVPTRPYVKSVSPGVGNSGVAPNAPIQVVFVNLGTNVPVLKVDGVPVAFTTSTVGNETTIVYTNAAGWPRAKLVNVSVEYAGAVGAWSFQTQTGLKALVVGLSAGDTLVSQRLASKFGLDVVNLPEGTVSANANNADTNWFMQFKLIWNSEAVASGGARPYINFIRNNYLPIPAINVEGANVADWRLAATGGGGASANNSFVIITNPASPFAAGLTGTNRLLNAGVPNGTWHTATSPLPETAFGACGTSLSGAPAVFGYKAGTVGSDGVYVHPARRVQLGIAGPGMIVNWTDAAWAMFDAAVAWVLPPKLTIRPAGPGQITVSWTGDGILQESATMDEGSWADSANQANPQTRPATGTKFFRVRQ